MTSPSPVLFEWAATAVAIALLVVCAWHNHRSGYKPAPHRGLPAGEFQRWLSRLIETTSRERAAH